MKSFTSAHGRHPKEKSLLIALQDFISASVCIDSSMKSVAHKTSVINYVHNQTLWMRSFMAVIFTKLHETDYSVILQLPKHR